MATPTMRLFQSLVVALVVFLSMPASAQTVSNSAKLGMYLGEKTLELNQIRSNVGSMMGGANEAEYHLMEMTNHYVNLAYDNFFRVLLLADIHGQMIDPKDQTTVRRYLQGFSTEAIASAKKSIEGINKQLVQARSPAFVSEAQKARDQIIAIRNEIERVVPQRK